MSDKILEKISNLSLYGYYDPSKNKVVVHFFDDGGAKQDIIAYLKTDMSWDVREIVNEVSVLEDNKETITIYHKSLGICPKDSKFDKMVRDGLDKIAQETYGDSVNFAEKNIIFAILEDNSYGD